MAGSWSTKLHTILRPAWDSPDDNHRNPKPRRHAPGVIWKKLLGKSVYFDLAGESFERRRRFVRLEALGLSGIIFYEISSGCVEDGSNSRDDALNETRLRTHLTRKRVFGDPNIPSDLGMGIDNLVDMVGAKVLYFPAYACTSFCSGQAMSSYLHGQPRLLPLPASEGFSVDAETLPPSCVWLTEKLVGTSCLSVLPAYPLSALIMPQRALSDALDSVSLDLCLSDSDSDDENDVSISTASSAGPYTPPRILSGNQAAQAGNTPTFAFDFDEASELGYVLCHAIDSNFDCPASPVIFSTQAAKGNLHKTLYADEKENLIPVIKA